MHELARSDQLSTLHRMLCLLTNQGSGTIEERLGQSLRLLCKATPLAAAGMVWDKKGDVRLDVRWPHHRPQNPQLESALDGSTHLGDLPVFGADGSWQIAPMRVNGTVVGRLWGADLPGHAWGDDGNDLLALAADQLTLAYHNARLCADLLAQTEQRAVLLQRITYLNEECRRHVARELHDEISQGLAALVLQADTIQLSLEGNPDRTRTRLQVLRQEAVRLQEEVQRLVLELRPALLEERGLLDALRWYGRRRLHLSGAQFHVSGGKCAPNLRSPVKLTLYRIGQEAIANSARHANASHVWLEISLRGRGSAAHRAGRRLWLRSGRHPFLSGRVAGHRPSGYAGACAAAQWRPDHPI